MLENLDEVNWAALRHAYGSAADVPDLIRAYACGRDDQDLLYGKLCHQGTVYSATAAAVPFFLELVKGGDSSLLTFLHQCAKGPKHSPAGQATREQIAFGSQLLGELLTSEQADMRLGAGHVLASCAELIPEAPRLLVARVDVEADDVVRAGLMHDLVEANLPQAAELLLAEATSSRSTLSRLSAGIALCEVAPERFPREVLHLMISILETLHKDGPAELSDQYLEASDGEDLEVDIVLALAKVPAGQGDSAVPLLLEIWRQCNSFYEAALAAVALAFPPSTTQFNPAQLSELQKRVVEAILADEALWKFCGDTGPLLESRGLPCDRAELRRLLSDLAEET